MTQPIYVVAFNYQDFKNWCRDHEVYFGDRTKVRHITEVDHIRGCRFEPGQVQYTERASEHRDFLEIIDFVVDRTINPPSPIYPLGHIEDKRR